MSESIRNLKNEIKKAKLRATLAEAERDKALADTEGKAALLRKANGVRCKEGTCQACAFCYESMRAMYNDAQDALDAKKIQLDELEAQTAGEHFALRRATTTLAAFVKGRWAWKAEEQGDGVAKYWLEEMDECYDALLPGFGNNFVRREQAIKLAERVRMQYDTKANYIHSDPEQIKFEKLIIEVLGYGE